MYKERVFLRLKVTLLCTMALLTIVLPLQLTASTSPTVSKTLLESYDRVLPLEGGSNFRDLGGYQTADGQVVRRGLLFRSAAMSSLTEADYRYLDRFDFSSVVDLRSSEERDLTPNQWVERADDVKYLTHDYSLLTMLGEVEETMPDGFSPKVFYRSAPHNLKPQLTLYFDALLRGDGAVVVNCSAGQDRTGIASALLLTALDVPRDTIVQDYLLSTQLRRPKLEKGNVDLKQAAKTNPFARMMLKHAGQNGFGKPQPLVTDNQIPYLAFAFTEMEEEYGSVTAYLEQAIGVDEADIQRLRQLYLRPQ